MNVYFRQLLAALVSGLSVPGSMGILGAAQEPWRQIREYLGLHGYQSAEEIHEILREKVSFDEYEIRLHEGLGIGQKFLDIKDKLNNIIEYSQIEGHRGYIKESATEALKILNNEVLNEHEQIVSDGRDLYITDLKAKIQELEKELEATKERTVDRILEESLEELLGEKEGKESFKKFFDKRKTETEND